MTRCGCGHVFFAHGPHGCRECGCTDTRGGLFQPDTSPETILQVVHEDVDSRPNRRTETRSPP
jgi:hypothetical protein